MQHLPWLYCTPITILSSFYNYERRSCGILATIKDLYDRDIARILNINCSYHLNICLGIAKVDIVIEKPQSHGFLDRYKKHYQAIAIIFLFIIVMRLRALDFWRRLPGAALEA
jgi:hypothetical protein